MSERTPPREAAGRLLSQHRAGAVVPGRDSGVTAPLTKSALSPARQRLIELLQETNFGRVENLEVRDGEPVMDTQPPVVLEYKFAAENGARPEAGLGDFTLKEQHLDLLRLLDAVGTGTITQLTCKHGLPFSAEVLG
jgi:hypothetical protein